MTPTRSIATLAAALIVIQPALARAQAQTAAAVTPAQSSTPPRSLFWDDFRRGWHFYEEPEIPPPEPPGETISEVISANELIGVSSTRICSIEYSPCPTQKS